MLEDIAVIVVGASIPVILGVVTFSWQQRASRIQRRDDERTARITAFLTTAYESLSAIEPAGGVGNLTIAEKQGLESAFRDAYLYGDEGVVSALNEVVDGSGERSLNPLLAALRRQLRDLLGLAESDEETTAWITTGWRHDLQTSASPSETVPAADVRMITGLDMETLSEYVSAGSLARPFADEGGQLHWPAAAVRSFMRSRDARGPSETDGDAPLD